MPPRDKLGLALAGGGFRAALFHVGVLHQLADCDLLRSVEVISTVSGGSFVGLLYALFLKEYLEAQPPDNQGRVRLEPYQYKELVAKLEAQLRSAIQKDLRNRLFRNLFSNWRIMVSPYSFGERMAKLYETYLLQPHSRHVPIKLADIKIHPGGKNIRDFGSQDLDSYNWAQIQQGGSVITKLVMNATSLNTGSRFLFTASEIGEWQYGYFRHDESAKLMFCKKGLKNPRNIIKNLMDWWRQLGPDPEEQVIQKIFAQKAEWPAPWNQLIDSWTKYFATVGPGRQGLGLYSLCRSEMGQLRLARETVRHLQRCHAGGSCSCGLTPEDHLQVLAKILGEECEKYPEQVSGWLRHLNNNGFLKLLYTLIEQIYLIRSAARSADTLQDDWEALTCAQALAASANFPPIFPAFPLNGFYDNQTVAKIGLTDGGVYDNLGIVGLLSEDCNYIISSDTGGILPFEKDPPIGHTQMTARIGSILTGQGSRQRRIQLMERHTVSAGLGALTGTPCEPLIQPLHTPRQLHGLALIRLDADLALSQEVQHHPSRPCTAAEVARVRTDLDGFSDLEMAVLINYGYATTGLYVKNFLDLQKRPNNQNLLEHIQKRYQQAGYPYWQAQHAAWVDPLAGNPVPQNKKPQTIACPGNAAEAILYSSRQFFRGLQALFNLPDLELVFKIGILAIPLLLITWSLFWFLLFIISSVLWYLIQVTFTKLAKYIPLKWWWPFFAMISALCIPYISLLIIRYADLMPRLFESDLLSWLGKNEMIDSVIITIFLWPLLTTIALSVVALLLYVDGRLWRWLYQND